MGTARRIGGRNLRALSIAIAIAVFSTGCSVTQVQTWFAIRGATVGLDDALTIANKINATEPARCDDNYIGACIPTNKSLLRCDSTPGSAPAVRGPFLVSGWDHFGLDPDGDKAACDANDPFGKVDSVHQVLDRVVIEGWAIDPNTNSATSVKISDRFYASQYFVGPVISNTTVVANRNRTDLATIGRGTAHGYSTTVNGVTGVHNVCVSAVNVGSGTTTQLACPLIPVTTAQTVSIGGRTVTAQIERYNVRLDRRGSWHLDVSGYAFATGPGPQPAIRFVDPRPGDTAAAVGPTAVQPNMSRSDVSQRYVGAPTATGFRVSQSIPLAGPLPPFKICITASIGGDTASGLACRQSTNY